MDAALIGLSVVSVLSNESLHLESRLVRQPSIGLHMAGDLTKRAINYVETRRTTGVIRPSTAKSERLILQRFAVVMGNRRLAQLGRPDIDRWLASMAHLAPATRRSRWSVVHHFLAHQVETGTLRRNPMNGIRPPKVPRSVHRSLDSHQVAALFGACRDSRDRLILELGLQLGLRRAEIASLEVGDVSFVSGEIRVLGKGGHEDPLPLTEAARRALRDYMAANPQITAGPLIRSYHPRYAHQALQPRWVGEQVRRISFESGVKVANFDGVATHSLRHTAATDVYRLGGDVRDVQDLLRHSSLATTSIYIKGKNLDRLRAAIEGRDYRHGFKFL